MCTVLRTIRKDKLEHQILDALRQRMMDPEIYRAFAAEFTAEWNRLQAESSGDQVAKQSELGRARGQLERLVDAIANGTPIDALQTRMTTLEARRLALEAELAQAVAPVLALHPNLPNVYRARVEQLAVKIEAHDGAEAGALIRGMTESVLLFKADGGFQIEVRGELANILGLAAGGPRKAEVLHEQVKMVAGVGFEPTTFRL